MTEEELVAELHRRAEELDLPGVAVGVHLDGVDHYDGFTSGERWLGVRARRA